MHTPQLPNGWVWTQVKDIAEFIRGVSYRKNQSSKTPQADYVPILRANNINGKLNYDDLVYVEQTRVKDEQFVKSLDIIIAMSSGSKLVPQDPNDEPASVLLEKIQKEKEQQQPKRKKATVKVKRTSSAKQLSLPID